VLYEIWRVNGDNERGPTCVLAQFEDAYRMVETGTEELDLAPESGAGTDGTADCDVPQKAPTRRTLAGTCPTRHRAVADDPDDAVIKDIGLDHWPPRKL
jgi:hypothetical protein